MDPPLEPLDTCPYLPLPVPDRCPVLAGVLPFPLRGLQLVPHLLYAPVGDVRMSETSNRSVARRGARRDRLRPDQDRSAPACRVEQGRPAASEAVAFADRRR